MQLFLPHDGNNLKYNEHCPGYAFISGDTKNIALMHKDILRYVEHFCTPLFPHNQISSMTFQPVYMAKSCKYFARCIFFTILVNKILMTTLFFSTLLALSDGNTSHWKTIRTKGQWRGALTYAASQTVDLPQHSCGVNVMFLCLPHLAKLALNNINTIFADFHFFHQYIYYEKSMANPPQYSHQHVKLHRRL